MMDCEATFGRAAVSAGYVVLSRMLRSRVEAPCLTCEKLIPLNTLVNWGAGYGIWCITCPSPRADREIPKVDFPPDCAYCGHPIVDPVPALGATKTDFWCRDCAKEWQSFEFGDGLGEQEPMPVEEDVKPSPKADAPASIGGDERF